MNTAIALRPLTEQECSILLKEQKSNGLPLYTDNSRWIPEAYRKQLELRVRELSKEDYGKLYAQLLQDVVNFGHLSFDGNSIAKRLERGKHSRWYYLRFALFHRSLNDFVQARYMDDIIRDNGVTNCKVYATSAAFMPLLKNKVEIIVKTSDNQPKKEFIFLLKYALIFFTRAFLGLFKMTLRKRSCKHLLILSQDQQDIIDLDTLKVVKGDPHLSYLSDMASENPDFLFLSQLKPPGLNDNHSLSWNSIMHSRYRSKTMYFESFLAFAFFIPSFYKDLSAVKDTMRTLKSLTPPGDAEQRYLLKKLTELEQMLYMAVHREAAARLFFSNFRPDSVGGVNEHSLQMKALFHACSEKGITTYGIQHGGVSANNIFYQFSDADKTYKAWPDYTLLRGNYTANMLSTTSSFPADGLKVLGHMRTDAIERLKQSRLAEVLPGLPDMVTIVLYATQGFPLSEASTIRRQVQDVFQALKELPNHYLVIKPHPNESNFSYYHEVAKQLGCSNYRIENNDLYRLLAVSDLVLTYYSTVGTEAVYFNKPLLVLDYTERDAQGFVREEVGIKVSKGSRLKEAIEHPNPISEEKRHEFIAERAYKIDGLVTKRHYEFIQSLAK